MGIVAPKRLLVVSVTKGFRHSSIATGDDVIGDLAARSGGKYTADYAPTTTCGKSSPHTA